VFFYFLTFIEPQGASQCEMYFESAVRFFFFEKMGLESTTGTVCRDDSLKNEEVVIRKKNKKL